MLSILPEEMWSDKTVIELGALNGEIGNFLQNQCNAKVTVVEGRIVNIEHMDIQVENVVLKNLDSPDWDLGKFDICLHFGLFYHLETYFEEGLRNSLRHCDQMFFETQVLILTLSIL